MSDCAFLETVTTMPPPLCLATVDQNGDPFDLAAHCKALSNAGRGICEKQDRTSGFGHKKRVEGGAGDARKGGGRRARPSR